MHAALDARASGDAFVQQNSTTRRLDASIRLRHAIAEATDLWLVYDEGLDTERAHEPGTVVPPRSLARSLIVKYTHAFGLF